MLSIVEAAVSPQYPAASIFVPFFKEFQVRKEVILMDFKIMTIIGAAGSWLAGLFGGWDTSL